MACGSFIDALNDPNFGLKVRERFSKELDAALRSTIGKYSRLVCIFVKYGGRSIPALIDTGYWEHAREETPLVD